MNIPKIKILFVCTINKMRSATAEVIYKNDERFEVKSAGTDSTANTILSIDLLNWADSIVVMEKEHRNFLDAALGSRRSATHRPSRVTAPARRAGADRCAGAQARAQRRTRHPPMNRCPEPSRASSPRSRPTPWDRAVDASGTRSGCRARRPGSARGARPAARCSASPC